MKRHIFTLIAVAAVLVASAFSQTTPNIGLNIPAYEATNWNNLLNANFTTLDLMLSGNQALVNLKSNGYHDFQEIATPANPASGYERWYASSATHQLVCLTSSGGSCSPSGSGSVNVNSGGVSSPNFNASTPAAPSGGLNIAYQVSGSSVSAYVPAFGASGSSHAPGLVPDPGSVAGNTRYLREDGTWDATAPLPLFASYTFYIGTAATNSYCTSGNFCAQNNASAVVDYQGTDAAAVIRSAIANISPTCGKLYFKTGVYNLNTVLQESTGGYSNYYQVGIPPSPNISTNQYCEWQFIGEASTLPIQLYSVSALQTTGVIFNETAAARTAAGSSSNKITVVWDRPDTTNSIGASTYFENIDVRIPDNQRGCETAIDVSQGLNNQYHKVAADTAVASASLAFPVAGTCNSWGGPSTAGLVGLTTTASEKEENLIDTSSATGYDVCLDVQSEHTVMFNAQANECNHGIDYGVRGGTIYHPSAWSSVIIAETARALTLGSNLASGARLDIQGLDIEDATSGIESAFQPVYHAKETNTNTALGNITFTRIVAGVGVSGLANLFDGGNGGKLTIFGQGGTSPLPTCLGNNVGQVSICAGPLPGFATTDFGIYASNAPSLTSAANAAIFGGSNFTQVNAPSGGSVWLTTNAGASGAQIQLTGNIAKMYTGGYQLAASTYSVLTGEITCNSTNEGAMAAVTDSTTNTWGATIAGSGSDHVMAYCDGTNWTVAGK